MSQRFYEMFVSLFFGFVVLLCSILAAAETLIFWYLTQNLSLYYLYVGTMLFSFTYGLRYFLKFRSFQNQLTQGLLIPSDADRLVDNFSKPEPLNIDLESKSLQVCLAYHNGSRYEEIMKNLGLSHSMQVNRELKKGLGFLLKFYEEHKEVKTI